MPVEILTVSLSDESIERIARRVAELRGVTDSNPPSSQPTQSAERSGFQNESDPWLDSPDSQQQQTQQPPADTQPQKRFCQHGEMRFVPAGTSANGKRYNAFYGCPLERGNPQQCRPVRP